MDDSGVEDFYFYWLHNHENSKAYTTCILTSINNYGINRHVINITW